MTEPSEPSIDVKETVRRPKPVRRRRFLAMVLCAIVLYWYGSALYQRLTWAWYWADNIQGFVAYGCHDAVKIPLKLPASARPTGEKAEPILNVAELGNVPVVRNTDVFNAVVNGYTAQDRALLQAIANKLGV